jgi:hypothetical protein
MSLPETDPFDLVNPDYIREIDELKVENARPRQAFNKVARVVRDALNPPEQATPKPNPDFSIKMYAVTVNSLSEYLRFARQTNGGNAVIVDDNGEPYTTAGSYFKDGRHWVCLGRSNSEHEVVLPELETKP